MTNENESQARILTSDLILNFLFEPKARYLAEAGCWDGLSSKKSLLLNAKYSCLICLKISIDSIGELLE